MKADVRSQTVEVLYDPAKTTPEALAKAISEYSSFEGSVKSAP